MRLFEMFRDPRYLAPLGVLVGVIFVSAALAHEGPGRSSASSPATPAVTFAAASDPEATPTPDAVSIDAHRLQDLTKLRDAFLAYRRKNGKFPVTKDGITTICAGEADPGCVLASVASGAPFADRDQPYWFVSDGSRVVLVAPAQAPSDSTQCPRVLPPDLAGAPVICLQFERPAQ
jgi:hypothetical protein